MEKIRKSYVEYTLGGRYINEKGTGIGILLGEESDIDHARDFVLFLIRFGKVLELFED